MIRSAASFRSGCDVYSMARTALSHNDYTYGLFRALWQRVWRSNSTGAGNRRERQPENEPTRCSYSIPDRCLKLLRRVNKHSNNVMARQLLLYTLAAEQLGEPGTEEAGRQVVWEWLRESETSTSVSSSWTTVLDLSRESRMTARDPGTDVALRLRKSIHAGIFVVTIASRVWMARLSRRFRDSVADRYRRISRQVPSTTSARLRAIFNRSAGEPLHRRNDAKSTLIFTEGQAKKCRKPFCSWLYQQ